MFTHIKKIVSSSLQEDYARMEILEFLRSHKTAERVLDVGGRNSPYTNLFPNRVGVDALPGEKVDFIGSAYSLPFHDDSFEVVLCTEVFEHLENPMEAAKEIFRVLQPGGKVILTTRFLYPIHGEPHDFFRYTRYGLARIFKNFECVSIKSEMAGWKSIAVILQGYAWEEKSRMSKLSFFLILFIAKIIEFLFRRKKNGDMQESMRLASGYHAVFKKPS